MKIVKSGEIAWFFRHFATDPAHACKQKQKNFLWRNPERSNCANSLQENRGRRRGIGERKSMKKPSAITIFDMLRQMLSRQYRTKIVRQMRRQIFRKMKQKAE